MYLKIAVNKALNLSPRQKSLMVTDRALASMYTKNKMTLLQIANIYGVSQVTIINRAKEYGIKTRRPEVIDVTGQKFERWSVIKRVEDDKWGADKFLCKCDCGNFGKVSSRSLRTGGSKSCGCLIRESASSRRGANHKSFKNGRTNKEGYVLLSNKFDHPNANKRGRILEHIFVMAEHIGRPIAPGETVHHKNGDRGDNRIENLELWCGSHSPGTRVADMIIFCVEFLKKHSPEMLK